MKYKIKKKTKIIIIFIIMLLVLISFSSQCFAENIIGNFGDYVPTNVASTKITQIGNTIITLLRTIGIVVSVIIIMILGIKYMLGSPSDKSEYKKTMVPYLVGAILLFAGSAILEVIYSLVQEIFK